MSHSESSQNKSLSCLWNEGMSKCYCSLGWDTQNPPRVLLDKNISLLRCYNICIVSSRLFHENKEQFRVFNIDFGFYTVKSIWIAPVQFHIAIINLKILMHCPCPKFKIISPSSSIQLLSFFGSKAKAYKN